MNLSISGHHLDVAPAIREYVVNKLARVLRHFDHVIVTQVMLSLEPLRHKAEITMRLPGKAIHCEAAEENLYAAIDTLVTTPDRKVIEHKDRVQNDAHAPANRQLAAWPAHDSVFHWSTARRDIDAADTPSPLCSAKQYGARACGPLSGRC